MFRSTGYKGDPSGSGIVHPWWTYPAPLGIPKVQDSVMACFGDEVVTPTGYHYAMHVACGTWLPGSHLGNAQDWDSYWQGTGP